MREADRSAPDAPDDGARSIMQEPLAPAAPSGTFFDYAPVHLITTGTLERLRGFAPASDFDACRFRPNIVVVGDGRAENEWPGARLRIGEIVLHIIDPTPRCIVTTLPQDTLPRDRDVLRTIAEHNSAPSHTAAPGYMLTAVAGTYGSVLTGGMARIGDRLSFDTG
jgi:uncharacterized protein